jgi:hypothetical protein
MADTDATEIQASGSTKISGATNPGVEDNYLDVDVNNAAKTTIRDPSTGTGVTTTTVGAKQAIDITPQAPAIDNFTTGTITALNGTVQLAVQGYKSHAIVLTGTWVASVVFEISSDGGTTWNLSSMHSTSGSSLDLGVSVTQIATSQTTNGTFKTNSTGGITHIRARASLFTSGTINVRLTETEGAHMTHYGQQNVSQVIVVSTNNSTTANLAAGATFTGVTDNLLVFNSINIVFKADQNCTIQVQHSSDNVNFDVLDTYAVLANLSDVRKFSAEGIYVRVSVTNNGSSTTTYLRLQTRFVPIDNPIARISFPFPNGETRVQTEAKQLFDDTYDTGLDTTNRWVTPVAAGGGVAASTNTPGDTALGTGTTANGYSILTSMITFPQQAPGWLVLMNAVNLESPIIANSYRFWGFGSTPGTPTATAPLTDAVGYEIATNGKMYAISYSGGSRNIIQDLSASTGNSTQPTDTLTHKYFIYFRGDQAYWSIDKEINIVATMLTGAPGPIVNKLPIKMLAIAGSTPPLSSAVLQSNAIFIGDTSGSSSTISDGTFAWRKATVDSSGNLAVKDAADGTVGVAAPTIATQVGGTNLLTGKLQDINVDANGNQYAVLTSPNGVPAGLFAHFNPAGSLNVSSDSSAIFSDPFDGGTLDTTNHWNPTTTAGGATITVPGQGELVFTVGTTASAKAILSSQPTFIEIGINFAVFGFIIQTEAAPLANVERFWGQGTTGTSYASPLTDAVGFELVGSVLQAVVYASGTKVFSQTITANLDGADHRYAVETGQGEVFWYIDNFTTSFELPVAFTSIRPNTETLPILIQSYNNSTPPLSGPTFNCNGVAVSDSGPNSTSIGDGTYRWRKATVKTFGAPSLTSDTELIVRAIPTDSSKQTYSAAFTNVASASAATDIFSLTGSATKVIRVNKITLSGTDTSITNDNFLLLKRSTANSSGTSTTATNVPHDSLNAAGTATFKGYTANPTLGTLVGVMVSDKLLVSPSSGGNTNSSTRDYNFGVNNNQCIVLRGINEIFSVNLNAQTISGGSFSCCITWTEE